MLDNWDKLTKYTSLMLYFVNPFSKLDKKWVINPHVHSKICDDKALRNGLKSMFEMVTALSEADIQQKFK